MQSISLLRLKFCPWCDRHQKIMVLRNVYGGLVNVPYDRSIKERGTPTSLHGEISNTQFQAISAHRNTTVTDNELTVLCSQPLTNRVAKDIARSKVTRAMSKKSASTAFTIQIAQPIITLKEALIGPDAELWREAKRKCWMRIQLTRIE